MQKKDPLSEKENIVSIFPNNLPIVITNYKQKGTK
jgi:hypothetical protein